MAFLKLFEEKTSFWSMRCFYIFGVEDVLLQNFRAEVIKPVKSQFTLSFNIGQPSARLDWQDSRNPGSMLAASSLRKVLATSGAYLYNISREGVGVG